MPSSRWVQSAPPKNVSQSDVRRLAQEKAARAESSSPSHGDSLPSSDTQPPRDSLTGSDRQPYPDRQADNDSQTAHGSLTQDGSQPERQPAARQNDSQTGGDRQPVGDRQARGDTHLGKESKGFLKIGNAILDQTLPTLDPFEQVVFLQLFRLSHGFAKSTCRVSLPTLSNRSNVKMTSLKGALKRLQLRGLIHKESLELGFGKDQGADFWVSPDGRLTHHDWQAVGGRQSPGDSIKRTLKETNIKDTTPVNLNQAMIEKSIETFQGLLDSGQYTIEMVARQFKAGYSEGDWQKIEAQLMRET